MKTRSKNTNRPFRISQRSLFQFDKANRYFLLFTCHTGKPPRLPRVTFSTLQPYLYSLFVQYLLTKSIHPSTAHIHTHKHCTRSAEEPRSDAPTFHICEEEGHRVPSFRSGCFTAVCSDSQTEPPPTPSVFRGPPQSIIPGRETEKSRRGGRDDLKQREIVPYIHYIKDVRIVVSSC